MFSHRGLRMLGRGRGVVVTVLLAVFVSAIALTSTTAASVAAKRVTGRLNASGYTVVALGYNGKATISKARSFSLVAPDSRLTLQLINRRTGRYAGPVVVGGKGSRVIVGIKAGAKLRTIHVNARGGYARVARPLAARWLDRTRFAQAHKGVPIGNGRNYGFVRSKRLGGGRGLGQDYDHSGVPNAFDVAENGNLIFNNFLSAGKPKKGPRALFPEQASGAAVPYVNAQIGTFIEETVNADAASIATAEIDSTMQNFAGLYMGVVPGAATYLDCSGALWCTTGGTGHLFSAGSTGIMPAFPGGVNSWGPAFPSCCNPNASGLGDILNSVTKEHNAAAPSFFALAPGASSSQIGTGSTFTEDATDPSGTVTPYLGTIQFMFTTEPALDSWSSGSDSCTVSYPVGQGGCGTPGNGTQLNPWLIGGGSGDVVVHFTFWRPQRAAVPVPPNGVGGDPCTTASPPCQWVDMGHFFYASQPFIHSGPDAMGSSTPVANCPASSYSTTNPNLVPATNPAQNAASLKDQANDAPANPANTLSYSLDLTSCFPAGKLQSGDEVSVSISAYDNNNDEGFTVFSFQIR